MCARFENEDSRSVSSEDRLSPANWPAIVDGVQRGNSEAITEIRTRLTRGVSLYYGRVLDAPVPEALIKKSIASLICSIQHGNLSRADDLATALHNILIRDAQQLTNRNTECVVRLDSLEFRGPVRFAQDVAKPLDLFITVLAVATK